MEFSLVIPCYNEELNIPKLFEKAKLFLNLHPEREVIFINNGSTDRSEQVFKIEQQKSENLNIKVLSVEINCGYGHGIMCGLAEAQGNFLGWTHADLQTDIMDCSKGFEIFRNSVEAVMVKGKRVNRPFFDKIISLGMTLFVFIRLHSWLNDINAQPKLFKRSFYDEIKEKAPLDFSLDLYFLLNAGRREKIVSFPVSFDKRMYGEAKGGAGGFATKINVIRRVIIYVNNYSKT